MNMPLVLLNRRRRGFTAFSPSTLFSSTAIGIWLDPSDLTTMFSDRAGTTPVTTPGTVVGLRLDKSKGLVLGSELVVNGDFSSGTTGWSLAAGWTVTGGGLSINQVGSTIGASQAFSVVAGRTYLFEFDVTAYTSGTLAFGTQTGASVEFGSVSSARHVRVFGIGGASNSGLRFYSTGAGFVGTIDNVSFKELPGNHAVAPTDAARPIYGVEPKGGRRNLLTWSEDFRNTAAAGEVRPWTWLSSNVTANTATAPNGTMTADLVTATAGSACHYVFHTVSTSGSVTCTVYAKAGTANWLGLSSGYTNGGETAWFDLTNGTRGTVASGGTSTMDPVVGYPGWWRCSHTRSSWTGGGAMSFVTNADGVAVFNAVGTENLLIWGAQLELGSTATAYQRVLSAYDVTESGVATCHYVQYDGFNSSMSTSAIDFTATDKMSVFAGVRKLSDAAQSVVVELSATIASNNGSFLLAAPDGATATFGFDSKGTTQVDAVASGLTAPISRIVTGLANIAGDTATIRIDGVQADQDTGDQGTGNFGNYPLFIGRRNNATLPFNGKDYGILVVGKAVTPTEITDTETWLAAKTSGVTI